MAIEIVEYNYEQGSAKISFDNGTAIFFNLGKDEWIPTQYGFISPRGESSAEIIYEKAMDELEKSPYPKIVARLIEICRERGKGLTAVQAHEDNIEFENWVNFLLKRIDELL